MCCQAGYLTANQFETETSDILCINGTQYSGLGMSRGPVGLSVAANTAVEWVADFSVSYNIVQEWQTNERERQSNGWTAEREKL